MLPSPSSITGKKLRTPLLLFFLAPLMIGAGKSEFYDANFESAKPPVYLKGVLGEEPELSKIAVRSIVPDSPAAHGGLRRGDEILSFAGEDLNHSARSLYQALYHLYETQSSSLTLEVNRAGEKQAVTLEPDYDPSHIVLGIQYGFIQPGGRRLRSVQFLKKEVSPEGVEHEAVYDFRDPLRVSAKCHWWGGKILVVEWDIFNDHKTNRLPIRLDQIKVTDQKGNALELLDPESVVHTIYNMEALHSVTEARFHWKKKEAGQILEQVSQLRDELSHYQITDGEVAPKTRFYGTLYYAMTPVQAPVSISAAFGKEKYHLKFTFDKEIASHYYPEPETPSEETAPPEETAPGGSSEDYDVLL